MPGTSGKQTRVQEGIVIKTSHVVAVSMVIGIVAALVLAVAMAEEDEPECGPENIKIFTGEEFAIAYDQYNESIESDSPDFPDVQGGCSIEITDTITNIASNDTVTYLILNGFENSTKLVNGLVFEGDITGEYQIGEEVTIKLKVISIQTDGVLGEVIDEIDGPASVRHNGLDAGTVLSK